MASDGIVLAADRRVTMEAMIAPFSSPKLQKWGTQKKPMHVVAAGDAGAHHHIQHRTKPRTPDELGCAVYDLEDDQNVEFLAVQGGQLYLVEAGGCVLSVSTYAMVGSGAACLLLPMRSEWKYNTDERADWWVCRLRNYLLPSLAEVNWTCGRQVDVEVFSRV